MHATRGTPHAEHAAVVSAADVISMRSGLLGLTPTRPVVVRQANPGRARMAMARPDLLQVRLAMRRGETHAHE